MNRSKFDPQMSFQPTRHETAVKDVEICQKRPVVPDGGWGWVVCFAAACTCFVVSGLASSAGIFLIGLRRSFDDHVSKLSTVGALIEGLSMMAAPVASILLNYFSHRTVLIIAGLIGCTGAVLGTFSVSINMMIVTYGLISGVSLGMSFFTCQIIAGLYFDKKRALAIGITNCGGGMGTMLFSLIVQLLLDFYGLRSTLLIIAGILLNITVLGALCRPLPYTSAGAGNTEYKDGTDHPTAMELPSLAPEYINGENIKQREMINEAFDLSDEKQNTGSPLPAEKSDIKDETIVEKQKIDGGSILKRCSAVIGVEIFKDINFVLLTISYTFWVSTAAMYAFIPPMCVWSFGMSKQNAALLMLFLGMFATIGELLLGVFVDFLHFSSNKIYVFSLSIHVITAILIPHCNRFEYMAPVVSVFGFASGLAVSLRLVLTTEVVGLEHSTKAFSVLSFFCGILFSASPPIYGLVFDATKSFVAIFYGGGTCALIAIIFFLLIMYRNKIHEKRLQK
ncbi:monocarboxylate transporter 12-like isoform X1 [Octopus sinensis]|uniref:Monocarboxylate transporter 12-like isoform X1 n=2 Tax=Octopus sinensis TaxID=2607531 RepID=A0A7E6FFP5_9MOLL|nr:monocarboxylate transporter 12-like isoform X1 [Octopus sinensis]